MSCHAYGNSYVCAYYNINYDISYTILNHI